MAEETPDLLSEVAGVGAYLEYKAPAANPTLYPAFDYTGATGWASLGGVQEIEPSEEEVAKVDTSDTLTPEATNTYIPGWTTPGEGTMTVKYNKSKGALLKSLKGVTKAFRIRFADGSGEGFHGFISKLGKKVDRENLVTQEVTFVVSGVKKDIAVVISA